jgi:predicted Zn-dependent protease
MQRVERQAMDAMALAMGLPACAFPQCALYHAENAGELDAKGRNLCPPCSMKLENTLKAQGVLPAR